MSHKNTEFNELRALAKDLRLLVSQIERLNSHRFLRSLNSTYKMLWLNFIQGIVRGLGTAIGATVVVTMIASILTAMDWVPFFGVWLDEISTELNLVK